jgi:hypothetical protein
LAPGVSGARQAEHAAPARGAPQLAQNFPDAAEPQEGQVTGEVIGVKSKRR